MDWARSGLTFGLRKNVSKKSREKVEDQRGKAVVSGEGSAAAAASEQSEASVKQSALRKKKAQRAKTLEDTPTRSFSSIAAVMHVVPVKHCSQRIV